MLTPEQRHAVSRPKTSMALIAGAGSGKTTVLVERYLELLKSGVKPREILTVTFTQEAAEEMRRRIADGLIKEKKTSLSEAVLASSQIGTIHSFAYRTLDKWGSLLGLPRIESILTSLEFSRLFEHEFEEWQASLHEEDVTRLLSLFPPREFPGIMKALFHERHSLQGKEIPPPMNELWKHLPALSSRLEAVTYQKGKMTFDDLEALSLRLMRDFPEVVREIREKIHYLLIDEFQDTSHNQWELLSAVTGGNLEKLFVVGDPKQSIYGFRKADIAIFNRISKRIGDGGGELHQLSVNFRAHPHLLNEVNEFSAKLFFETEIPFFVMQSHEGAPQTSSKEHFRICSVPEETTEMAYVADDIKDRVSSGESPEHFVLLFRVSDRMHRYAEELEKRAIPTFFEQSYQLFEIYDVVDLANYIHFTAHPESDFHFAEFLRSRYIKFSIPELWNLHSQTGESLFEKSKPIEKLRWLHKLVEDGETGIENVLMALFRETGEFPANGEAVLQVMKPLLKECSSIKEASDTLKIWSREEVDVTAVRGNRQGSVKLMTVHGAKGLEFPHVYVVDNARNSGRSTPSILFHPELPPGVRYKEESGEMVETPEYTKLKELRKEREEEESRRILYVAITRAKRSLTLVIPENEKKRPKNSWAAIIAENALEDALTKS